MQTLPRQAPCSSTLPVTLEAPQTMYKRLSALILSLALMLAVSGATWAHGDIPRTAEPSDAEARLFVADATNGDLISLDLPTGDMVSRLSTPRYIMSLALSSDEQHLFTMRGRSTYRDFITVVNTGLDAEEGRFYPPYVARTIPVDTPGPGWENRMLTVRGKDALMMEGTAEFVILDDNAFTGLAPISVRTFKLGAPDHYFYLEEGDNLYVGHLRKGYVQVINSKTGEEVTRIEGCPLNHGKGKDEVSGRLFYACMRDVMVIGTRGDEQNQVVGRIPYPENQRIGAFIEGAGRILWGYTEGILPIMYRFDPAVEPYQFEVVTLGASIRQWATEGGKYFLSLTRGGVLQIRDGGTGELLRTAQVSKPFAKDYHEHVGRAILPDIKSMHGDAYVSLPHEGRIALVDLETAEIKRYFDVGGEPTRIVLVEPAAAAARAAAMSATQ